MFDYKQRENTKEFRNNFEGIFRKKESLSEEDKPDAIQNKDKVHCSKDNIGVDSRAT